MNQMKSSPHSDKPFWEKQSSSWTLKCNHSARFANICLCLLYSTALTAVRLMEIICRFGQTTTNCLKTDETQGVDLSRLRSRWWSSNPAFFIQRDDRDLVLQPALLTCSANYNIIHTGDFLETLGQLRCGHVKVLNVVFRNKYFWLWAGSRLQSGRMLLCLVFLHLAGGVGRNGSAQQMFPPRSDYGNT